MSWKNVQYENGKMRTSEGGGGGGSSTFAGLDDVNFLNLQNGQVPKYNSTTQKWENANESGGGGTVTDVTVDGTSVVNQQGIAEITMPTPPSVPDELSDLSDVQFSNLTDHQPLRYNATSQKWENGADGFPPLIYSLEEREVGVWTDGKPLYCQTVKVEHLTRSGNWQTITHNIANIDKIADFQGKVYINTDQAYWVIPAPRAGSTNGYAIFIDRTYIHYINNIHDTNVTEDVSFTIYYTKTTDVAGSGTWTTDGTYAHHYSTSEKVIGTWMNKPLYELSLELTNTNVNSEVNIDVSSYNIDFLINSFGSYSRKTGNFYAIYSFGHYESTSHYGWFRLDNNSVSGTKNTRLTYKIIAEATDKQIIVLQYTKTTD